MKAEPNLTNQSLNGTKRVLHILARSVAFLLLVVGTVGFALLLLRPSSGARVAIGIPAAGVCGTAWATVVALRKDGPNRRFPWLLAGSLNLLLFAFGVYLGVTTEEILFLPLGALFAISGVLGAAGVWRNRWLARERLAPQPESPE